MWLSPLSCATHCATLRRARAPGLAAGRFAVARVLTKKRDVSFRKSSSALYYRRQAALVKCCGAPGAAHTPERVCSRRPPAPPQEHRVDGPGVTSPSRPLQIGRAKMGGRGRADGSEGTPGRKKRRQKQGSPPQVGDEITTELDSYTLPSLSPLVRTRRGNWRLFICSCRARLPNERRSARQERVVMSARQPPSSTGCRSSDTQQRWFAAAFFAGAW